MSARRADIAYLAALLVGTTMLVVLGIAQWRIDTLGVDDFSTIWAGPRALVMGADPYDPATWPETAVRVGTHVPDTAVYLYPPWVSLALLPFALLPPRPAGALWTLIGVITALVAMRALLRAFVPTMPWVHGIVALLLLVSMPAIVTLVTGQWTLLLVAALAGVVLLLRSGQTVAAGLLAVFMLAKPPLFVFTAAAFAVRALWPGVDAAAGRRFVATAAAGAVATIAIAWLMVPSWWPAWFEHVAAVQVGIEPVTIQTLFVNLFGRSGGWIAPPVLLGSVAAALQFHPRGEGWLPVWLALSSAGTIYSNTYDLLLLLVPIVLAVGALRQSPRRAAVVLFVGAVLLTGVMLYLHTIYVRGYAASVPLLVFVVVTAALWRDRRALAAVRPPRALRESA